MGPHSDGPVPTKRYIRENYYYSLLRRRGDVCITINFIGDKKFFNEIEGERIKTKKMRGQLSQGLVLDLKDSVIMVIHKELK